MTELDLQAILAGGHDEPEGHRSGIVALAGRPNVGKSTLLNAMVGAKVAITTPVPGTTRNAIRGVVTREGFQLVFIDTPGLAKPRTLLNRRLNELVLDTWRAVDVICLLVDAQAGIGRGDAFITERLAGIGTPTICVVNKADVVGKDGLLPVLAKAAELGDWAEVVPISALTGDNVEHLVDVLAGYVPEGPRLFPPGTLTDQPERQLIAEIVREKYLTRVFEEVPHSIAVSVEEMQEREDGLLEIYVNIYVERDSQKAIVIGRGGSVLREANSLARQELEALLGARVFLDVRVKVAHNWQRDPRRLQRFGY